MDDIKGPARPPSTKPPTRVHAETQANYELPKAVEALRAGWLATFQGAATVSALLGGIEAGLLVFFHDDINFGAPHPSCRCGGPDWVTTTPQKSTLILTYLSLVLSLAVTVTSYALTAEFSILPSRAAKDNLHINSPPGSIRGSNWDILRHYGLRNRMFFVWRFWFFSLMGAVLCAVLSVATFVGTREDTEIRATVLVSVGFFAFPMLSIIWIFKGE